MLFPVLFPRSQARWGGWLAVLLVLAGCGPMAEQPSRPPATQPSAGTAAEPSLPVPVGVPPATEASRASQAPAGAGLPPAAEPSPEPRVAVRCDRPRDARLPPGERYKQDVACHLSARNAQWLYGGRPPPMLKSVIVLSIHVDARGEPRRVAVLRSNGLRDLEQRARQSVRDASPLPLPERGLLRNGTAELTETWLFRDDGRFQLRSLALAQP